MSTDESKVIAWEPPPEAPRRGARKGAGRIQRALSAIAGRRGEWAVLAEYDERRTTKSACVRLRAEVGHRGPRFAHLPTGAWEFVVRPRGGRYAIYARYLGPKEEVA